MLQELEELDRIEERRNEIIQQILSQSPAMAKQYRERHGLSIDEFAARLGCSRMSIHRLERGQYPYVGMRIIRSLVNLIAQDN
jgi:DNA-binding XRE family transcriptional regulator